MNELYNKNIKWIKDNTDKCFINRGRSAFNVTYKVISSKEDNYPSLIAVTETEEITIHSQMYPLKEAEKIAQNIDFKENNIIVVGFGLAFVCQKIREKYPDRKIILIEPDIKLFYLTLKYCDLNNLNFSQIYVAYEDSALSQFKFPAKPDIFILKSQERLFSALYSRIKNILLGNSNYSLSDQWKYRKFTNEQARIIFIDSSYVLSKECLHAIKNTGNIVHYIHIDVDDYDYEKFFRNIMNDIAHFKPDFVLTINHLGFDKEGRLTDLFNEMELPFVSWFVDSPNVILSTFNRNISDYCNIFVWDDDYINQVKEKGYKNCEYLPLATDTDIFYPQNTAYLYNVSFVGSSMVYAIHKNMQSWVHRDDLLIMFPEVVKQFLKQKNRLVENSLHLLTDTKVYFDSSEQEEDFKSAVLWKATQVYRNTGLFNISDFMPTVAGDSNWKNILPLDFEIIKERWYYDDLCDYYNQSKINFNMTSLQMTNAVNQRVFDVSACRKFILTDYRKQIDELFDGKNNIIYFNDVNEIADLVRYYSDNNLLRDKISNNAYEIVLNRHTYKHRIKTIIDLLRKKYN